MDYEKGYVYELMDPGGPTDVFELKTSKALVTRDTMTDAQFNSMMKTGLAQAVSDDSSLAKDVFEELRKRV